MPVIASSTSIQKCLSDFFKGNPSARVDNWVTRDVSCFYTFSGT
jgi:hypothetical protein